MAAKLDQAKIVHSNLIDAGGEVRLDDAVADVLPRR
jgi:hypothetical protein